MTISFGALLLALLAQLAVSIGTAWTVVPCCYHIQLLYIITELSILTTTLPTFLTTTIYFITAQGCSLHKDVKWKSMFEEDICTQLLESSVTAQMPSLPNVMPKGQTILVIRYLISTYSNVVGLLLILLSIYGRIQFTSPAVNKAT